MDRLLLIVLTLALGVFSYAQWDKSNQLETELEDAAERAKINITSSMLSKATEFTFMKITNSFSYYMDRSFGEGLIKGRWKALYEWDYTFNFGFKILEGWQWCIDVNHEEGIVTLNAPKISQLNDSSAAPEAVEIFNAGNRDNTARANAKAKEIANKKMAEAEKAYLSNKTIQSSVKKSLGAFFQEILNDAHEYSNPIRKVNVNLVSKSSCKK